MGTAALANGEEALERFRYGGCYAMAYALAETLGWQVECLSAQWSALPNFPHAWVVDSEGRALDAFGFTTRESIHAEFIEGSPRLIGVNAVVRFEQFDSPGSFFARLAEGYGDADSLPEYEAFFRKQVCLAKELIEAIIIPRHLPALSRALLNS